ncbi:hypothetical protein CH063_04302 [Colletotrichum higginsianum]|uniref:Uncharacterized protein n=2 Tax=Colletotrichum higginsianum TaxID=80884 RepID=H1W5S6_COLHI|nr:hypothetical protein CH63R_04041 [Colletotrichum higginsianum IMI 349063]OBR11745.1 hypothetical protein CH63R_04041 [Colletotrichum higginsianum IMI 349063]TID00274.1 hypothetical protein CH35J_006086 [Colletotrichum higginsianum]CCF47840.1 hypothetical protein CH063_04302 [Colletotrichum higginsianum]
MPPKKRSNANEAGEASGTAKKTKTTASGASAAANESRWSTKSKRWSAVSASRNADDDYKKAMEDIEYAYTYTCRCPLGTKGGDPDDEDEDEEDDYDDEEDDDDEGDEGEKQPKAKCDGGKTCLCMKPAAEHPDAPFVITNAGYRKLMNQQVHCQVRDPDNFDMYTYNDHYAYGILQVIQNLVLDYEEAKENWREQWVICEAIAPFIWFLSGGDFAMADDGELCRQTARLIGNLFLATLARLEREGALAPDSEVKDLGIVMAGMLKVASAFRGSSLFEGETRIKKSKKRPFPFVAETFDNYVAAYAKKHGITLRGVPKLKGLLEGVDDDVELPTVEQHGEDPWGWAAAFSEYKTGTTVGGDGLDITSWTSAERKKHAFNKKDPLGKKELDAIKKGLVMMLG